MSASAESLPVPTPRQPSGPNWRPLLTLIGVAAAVAVGVAIALWSKDPTYSVLVSKESNAQVAQIAQALDAAGIPYRADTDSGAILVPAERLDEARLKLAGQGLSGDGDGFDALAKDPGFGVSQFMENARYQHALEAELARTIGNLQPVAGARVHLALPRQSAFVRDRRPASASVFVQLKSGRRLAEEQVTSIVNLVASSIPELDADHITVVDQQGHLLSAPEGNDDFALRDKEFEYSRRLEDVYSQRVEDILSALVGPGRVHAQVVADVEMSVTEQASEQYRPGSQVVRSEQQSEEQSRGPGGPQGVPGALTNQPPQGGTALPAGAAAPTNTQNVAASQEPNTESKQSTRNYEIDRTLAYTKSPPGKLKRLTVAVLVDNARTTDADGNVKVTPLSQAELDKMTRLVKDTVGFDEKRGDNVSVVNAPFQPTEAPDETPLPSTPIWERPIVRDIAKILAGLVIVSLLVTMVIRPLMKALVAPLRIANDYNSDARLQPMQVLPPGTITTQSYDQQITDARGQVQQDPRRVAQVVKSWVGQDE